MKIGLIKIGIALFAICASICAGITSTKVQAADPKVMVTDYEVVEKEVTAGDEFTLKVTVKNTAEKNVTNLKIKVESETGEIIPAEGAGTDYLKVLEAENEHVFTFKLKAANGIEEKTYKLNVTNEYEDKSGYIPYQVVDTIYVPVKVSQSATITDIYFENDIVLGDSVEIMANVNNTGRSTIYNVSATIVGGGLADVTTFVGNIEPGKSGAIDSITKAINKTGSSGDVAVLKIQYEDVNGNVTAMEERFTLTVSAPVYDNIKVIKDNTKKDYTSMIAWIVGCALICGIIIFFGVRKMKRKKAILEEFQ